MLWTRCLRGNGTTWQHGIRCGGSTRVQSAAACSKMGHSPLWSRHPTAAPVFASPVFAPEGASLEGTSPTWSVHDGKFCAAHLRLGEARAPNERKFQRKALKTRIKADLSMLNSTELRRWKPSEPSDADQSFSNGYCSSVAGRDADAESFNSQSSAAESFNEDTLPARGDASMTNSGARRWWAVTEPPPDMGNGMCSRLAMTKVCPAESESTDSEPIFSEHSVRARGHTTDFSLLSTSDEYWCPLFKEALKASARRWRRRSHRQGSNFRQALLRFDSAGQGPHRLSGYACRTVEQALHTLCLARRQADSCFALLPPELFTLILVSATGVQFRLSDSCVGD